MTIPFVDFELKYCSGSFIKHVRIHKQGMRGWDDNVRLMQFKIALSSRVVNIGICQIEDWLWVCVIFVNSIRVSVDFTHKSKYIKSS